MNGHDEGSQLTRGEEFNQALNVTDGLGPKRQGVSESGPVTQAPSQDKAAVPARPWRVQAQFVCVQCGSGPWLVSLSLNQIDRIRKHRRHSHRVYCLHCSYRRDLSLALFKPVYP